jgi:hypothetical protein
MTGHLEPLEDLVSLAYRFFVAVDLGLLPSEEPRHPFDLGLQIFGMTS